MYLNAVNRQDTTRLVKRCLIRFRHFKDICRDRDGKTGMVRFQGLIYSAVDIEIKSREYTWHISEYEVSRDRELVMPSILALDQNPNMLVDIYLSGEAGRAREPYVSPIFAEALSGMPDTLIANAEYDYLRLAYGRKLSRDGVRVSMLRYNGMDHAFMDKLGFYSQAEDVIIEIAKAFINTIGGVQIAEH